LDHEVDDLSASDDEKDSGDEGKHENLLQAIKSLSSSGKKKYVYLKSKLNKNTVLALI